jgi:hypothetical protein
MSAITATVVSQPITASVSGTGSISANVGASSVSVTASGGIGPQGAAGNLGAGLGDLTDVHLSAVQDGDVLRYDDNKWRNETMSLNGGNF